MLPSLAYGHAGDGNMHCTVIGPPADDWHEVLRGVQEKIYSAVIEMGGTLSGEHGIGFKRKADMKLFLDKKQLDPFYQIKQFFVQKELHDPDNILNPGKIVEWNE